MPTEPPAPEQSHARPSLQLLARISQYEVLSRMWAEKSTSSEHLTPPKAIVYSQDFAYEHSVPVILEETLHDIGNVKASDFADLLSGPTVEIVVGKGKRCWTLHKKLLCRHSPFFERELMAGGPSKTSPKAGLQKLELLEDDPAGFELFVKWLYQGRLDSISDLSDEAKYEYAVACHKLYRLCERLDMPELKNLSMDQYRLSLNEAQLVPDAEEITEIYSIHAPDSPFRRLMVNIAARQIMDPDSSGGAESYRTAFKADPDFAVDMINAIKAGSGGMLFTDPTEGGECEYHDHSQGAGCIFIPRQRPKSLRSPLRSKQEQITDSPPGGHRGKSPAQSVADHIDRLEQRERVVVRYDTDSVVVRGVSGAATGGSGGGAAAERADSVVDDEDELGRGHEELRRRPAKLRRGAAEAT